MIAKVLLVLGALEALVSAVNTIIGLITGAAGIILEFIQGLLGTVIYVLLYLPVSFLVVWLHSILINMSTIAPVPRNAAGDITIFGSPEGGKDVPMQEMLSITGDTIADGYMEPIAILIVLIGIGLVLFIRIFDVVIDDMQFDSADAQRKLILAPILIFLWLPLSNIILALAYSLSQVFLNIDVDATALANSVEDGGYFDGDNNELNYKNLIQSVGPDFDNVSSITNSSLIAVILGLFFLSQAILLYIIGAVLAMVRLFLLYLLYAIGPLAIAMWAFSWKKISDLGKTYIRYFVMLALFPIPAALINTLAPIFILMMEAILTGGATQSTVNVDPSNLQSANLDGTGGTISASAFGLSKVIRSLAIVFIPVVVTFGPWAFVVGLGKAMAAAGVATAATGAAVTGGAALAAGGVSSGIKSAASTVQQKGAVAASKEATGAAAKKAGSGLRKATKPAKTAYETYQSDDESLARQMGRRERQFESTSGERLRSAGNTAGELVGLREGKTASQRLGGSVVSGIESAEDVKRGIGENKEQLTKAMSNSRSLRAVPGGGVVQGVARYSQRKDDIKGKRDAVMAEMHKQKVTGNEIRDSNGFLEDHLKNDEVASIARENLSDDQKSLVRAEEKAAAQDADGIIKQYLRSMNEDPSMLDNLDTEKEEEVRASLFDNALTNAREHMKDTEEDLTMAEAMDEVYGKGMGDNFTSAMDLDQGQVLDAADNEGKILSEVKERYMGDDKHGMLQSEYHQSYEDTMTEDEKQMVQSARSNYGEVEVDGESIEMAEVIAHAQEKSLSGVATSMGVDKEELTESLANNSSLDIDTSEIAEDELSGEVASALTGDIDENVGDALVKGIVKNEGTDVRPEDSLSSVVVENIEQNPQSVAEDAKQSTEVKKTVEKETKETVERQVPEKGVAVSESNPIQELDNISPDAGSDAVQEALENYVQQTVEQVEEGATAKLEEMDNKSASEVAKRASEVAQADVEEFENEIRSALEESDKVDVLSSADTGKLEQTRRNMLENFSNEMMKDMDKVNMDTLDTEVRNMDPEAKRAVKDMQQEVSRAVTDNMSEIQRSMSESARDAIERRAEKDIEDIADGTELLGVMNEVDSSGEADLSSQISMIEDNINNN